jgi:tRNA (uracil-5-)-methyltransferase TRM9
MDRRTQDALLKVNRRFYQQVASHFDATRQGWTPGLFAILPYFEAGTKECVRVLDVGCGNGRFARLLAQQGISAVYTGIDGNGYLLSLARGAVAELEGVRSRFILADLADPGWAKALSGQGGNAGKLGECAIRPAGERTGWDDAGVEGQVPCPTSAGYDVVLCTATLQHLPGYELRLRLLRDFRRLGAKLIILSFWQFLDRERFRTKLIEPQHVGIQPSELEPGDGLLPWRQGVEAIRYVHQVDEAELRQLAADAGLSVLRLFRADGRDAEAGETPAIPGLNLYAILTPDFQSSAGA